MTIFVESWWTPDGVHQIHQDYLESTWSMWSKVKYCDHSMIIPHGIHDVLGTMGQSKRVLLSSAICMHLLYSWKWWWKIYLLPKIRFSTVTADFVTFQRKKILDIFSTMNKCSAKLSHVIEYMEFAWLFISRQWVTEVLESTRLPQNSHIASEFSGVCLKSTWSPLELIWSPIIKVYCIGLHNFIVHHSIEKPTIISLASITPTTLSIMVKVK